MQVLLENATFLLHKIVRITGIIRVAGIIQGRVLYEEIRHIKVPLRTVGTNCKVKIPDLS